MTRELVQSLNVLAGTTGLGMNGAAAVFAGIATPYPDALDSLNRKAGNKLPNYRDWNGVCNQLAGTIGLEAQDALDRYATAGAYTAQTWASITGTWAANTHTWATV